jgi:hypothetical protein
MPGHPLSSNRFGGLLRRHFSLCFRRVQFRGFFVLLAALPLFSVACRDTKIAVYRIPKENDSTAAPASASAPAQVGMPGLQSSSDAAGVDREGDGLVWTAPAHWKTKVASAMRKASYTVGEESASGGDFAITAFPGDVGGDLANVNRWRGQLQLPPLSETELAGVLTLVDAGGLKMRVVDLAGTVADKPQRMLGAIVPYRGTTWFFKLTGPDTLIANEKPVYLEFLQTVKPSSFATTVPVVPTVSVSAAAETPRTDRPGLKWTAPANWVNKPASAMRKATYLIPGEDGAGAELSVTAFPGAVGGELANVNRWRGQLQLPPLAEDELGGSIQHLTVNGLPVALVDLTGGATGQPQRILGAIVQSEGDNWFFKLTGPAALVAGEKPAFLSFVQTLQAP